MQDMVQAGVPHVPPDPLEVGDTWQHSVTAFGLTVDTTHTLRSANDGAAQIEVAGDLSGGEDGLQFPGLPEMPGMDVRYDEFSGEYAGTYNLDVATGLAVDYSVNMTMDIAMTMQMPTRPGQDAAAGPSVMSISLATAMTTEGELRRAE